MFRKFIVLSICLFSLTKIPQVFAEDRIIVTPNHASGPHFTVDITRAVKTELPGRKDALSIQFSYNFSALSSVKIRGLGVVPASGSFSYVTSEKTLLFNDPAQASPLVEVPFQETLILAARPPLTEIPQEFPREMKIYDWNSAKSLQESANRILNQYFQIREFEENNINFIVTTYADVDSLELPKGVIGQVALQFSFPYDPKANAFSLHVQSVVREGRELSDEFRPASTPEVLKVADSFISKIIDEIKAGKNRHED